MKTIKARLNHGRWIADCPDCNSAELAEPGKEFACMGEALDRARSEFKKQGRDLMTISHDELLTRARQIATLSLPHYPVDFPKDKFGIDALMTGRPVENQNWESGETLADLQRENKVHGVRM